MWRGGHLFEKSAFLNDVGDGLHFDAFCLVDVLEGVELASLLVLDDADLGGCEGEREIYTERHTLPKAPLPTQRRRIKWKRVTSPSKSMG